MKADQSDFLGTYSTGSATAVTNGNVTRAFGSGMSGQLLDEKANSLLSST
jgi:hypothetical protein